MPRIRIWLFFFLVSLLSCAVLGLKKEGVTGVVLGGDAGFEVTAPEGWVFDNETYRITGRDALIRPLAKARLGDEEPYIGCSAESRVQEKQLDEFANYQALATLETDDGRVAVIYEYQEEEMGEPFFCRAAYVQSEETLCQITLNAPSKAALKKVIPAFESVVKSFRYLGPHSGKFKAASTARRLLVMTTEIQDRIDFVPSKGWSRLPDEAGVTLFQYARGESYGLIAAYDIKPGEGEPDKDFAQAWSELAQPVFDLSVPASQSMDSYIGWPTRIGSVRNRSHGETETVLLGVLSNYGRRISILAKFNDTSLSEDVEKFIRSVSPRLHLAASGEWTNRGRSKRQFLNGGPVSLGDYGVASRSYSFGATDFHLDGVIQLKNGTVVNFEESGTYSVSGNQLTLQGQGGVQVEQSPNDHIQRKSLPSWTRTYRFKLLEFADMIHGPYLILTGVEENNFDGSYSTMFPDSFVYVLGYH